MQKLSRGDKDYDSLTIASWRGAIKGIGKRGINYLDNNRILKKMGEFLGENIVSPILSRIGYLTAPLVDQIKNAIRRKLNEAQETARQVGEEANNVIDDVTDRPQLATEGAGNVHSRMETEPSIEGNGEQREKVGFSIRAIATQIISRSSVRVCFAKEG